MKLLQDVARPRWGIDFTRRPGADGWVLILPRPDALRMEYVLELVHMDGGSEIIPDPHNPTRVEGPFGQRSVIEFPGYNPPEWVTRAVPHGEINDFKLRGRGARARASGLLWAAAGVEPSQPVPLLVVHDGPEYAKLSALTQLLDVLVADGRVPLFRAALLQPEDRNEIYSVSAAYARGLAHEIVPNLQQIAPTPHGRRSRIGMGASLGALAMLHVHRRFPAVFGALFLQSGSFFRPRSDRYEAGFPRFRRIARFVGEVLAASDWPHPIPVAITCGTAEENLANNRSVHDALVAQGYEVTFNEALDAHTWTGWRDTFDPGLAELLAKAWA